MTCYYKQFTGTPPVASELVELCHNSSKTMVWLQLTNSDWIMGGNGGTFVRVYIGAYPDGRHWHAMDAKAATWRDATHSFGNKLGPSKDVARFQRAITLDWKQFDGYNPGRWAKGLTFGTSISTAGFVMKALKTGFDAMGGGPLATYSGMRVKGFTVDDAIDYLARRAAQSGITVSYGGVADFEELAPDPAGQATEDPARTKDPRNIPVIPSTRPHGGRYAYATETAHIRFPRVNAYGFRGDSRAPSAIKDAGGFNPNYTRPDHIAQNVGQAQDQALNIGSFLKNQNYGGYISVCKSYAITKGFASGMGGTTARGPGWVYACLVEGAFNIPPAGLHGGINVPYNEQELSMPGLIDWDDVMGYRKVDQTGVFEGNIFLRRIMRSQDPQAYKKIWDLLSGQSQGPG
jgi:hypothetical protein